MNSGDNDTHSPTLLQKILRDRDQLTELSVSIIYTITKTTSR